ncbi:translation initiation factor IF-2-like [Cebus imitator]|uniref:translation initiation factor IF-2-like n=1 Tax=Cebus imitator TaxID=2715852 RepID=UPI00189979D0|nr:translation initiation factor IF-2-like [Cebus imitator]
MSSSGEEDQAVHGSSAPPAAAAQTVAAATAAAGARARAPHLSPCPAPRGRGSTRANSSPHSPRSPSAHTETPFVSRAFVSGSPRPPPRAASSPSRSELPAAQRSPTSAGLCAWRLLLSPEIEASARGPLGPEEWERRVPERAVASRRLTSQRLPLGSGAGLLARTLLPGRRCGPARAPAKAESRAGTGWSARGDAEQPPDAATAPLRAPAPETFLNTGAFRTALPHPRSGARARESERAAGSRNGPGDPGRAGRVGGAGGRPGSFLQDR